MDGLKSNNYRNGGVTSGTFFINESSLSQLNQSNYNQQQSQQYSKVQNNYSRSSVSPQNSQYSRFSKQDYDSSKKQIVRGSVSSDNQQDNDDLIRNAVHKVEIDSEGVIQEKTYQQVLDQNNQRESKLKEIQNNKKINLIKVEEDYSDNTERIGRSSNSSKNINNNLNFERKSKERQLNYSYVSFDDNGDNFMTNQTDEQSEFNTKQSNPNNKNRFSSISSTSTAVYQKKIDEIQSELKEKISFLIALEEELLETKTQLNMQKLENSSHKERISKLQKDNQLMQRQITQLGETIKNLEKASNSLVNQILFIKNNNETNQSKDHSSSISNLDGLSPIATYQEYINDIVKSNINLRCNLEELNQKYSQLKNQINSSVFTHSSPVSTRIQNPQLESTLNISKHRNNFLRGQQEVNLDRSSLSPSNISEISRRSQSPMQGGMNIEDYEKNLSQSRQYAQHGLSGRVREIREAGEKFINKYLKNKRRNCTDEQDRQFYVELDNEFQLFNSNIQKMESYLEEIKFENESRVKNAREQFQKTLKEIESIKKIAEERNKILIDQVKSIEQENIHLNQKVETYKGSLMENEKGLDESRIKMESFQKSAEDYQNMLKQVNDTLAIKNEEVIQLKQYRDNIEKDLNDKVRQIKELKLENSENNQFIRKLQEQIISVQRETQEKQDAFNRAAQQLKEDSEKRVQMIQQDTFQIQNREKEYLEKEIKLKEKENQLLSELSQRDQIISNLQEQINEINQNQLLSKIESENKSLKSELDNLKSIKKEFENNFNTLQSQIMTLKSENKELKNDDIERKMQHYEKYLSIEQKLGLQQTDILLLIEKLPLAEQELQNIVELNEKLSQELNSIKSNKQDNEKNSKEWKNKYEKLSQEMKRLQEQSNQERDMLKENIKQQTSMNQQLQKQNQTLMKNCEVIKSGYSNLECQIQNLVSENELLSQKSSKLEDCLQLLVKERELIKKQSNGNKLQELTQSQQNVIQQINQNQRESKIKPQIQDNKKEQLKINTSKDCIIPEQPQQSVSPNTRSSKQSSKINKALSSSSQSIGNTQSNGNLNNMQSNTSHYSKHSTQSQNNQNKPKQQPTILNNINSIQTQQSNRQNSNNSNKNQQNTSSQQIKQMQQYHAMQGIQQQQLASLSPMSQKKQSQVHQSVQSNASTKNLIQPQQSISPKSNQRNNEQSKQQMDKSKQILEKENNGIQQDSIKISKLIQNSNQFGNNLAQSLSNNLHSGSQRSIASQQNIIISQNLRQSNQSNNSGYSRESSSRINKNNFINIAQQEEMQQRNFKNHENENTFSIEESQSQLTNRIGDKTQSQHDGFRITSEEGYSNNMYSANHYEDSNNQQWKIKSLRDNPYEIVKKNDKNVDQTFAEADNYEDFEERQDFDQLQQQERFEREIQQREQNQKDFFLVNQKEINEQENHFGQDVDSNNSDLQMMGNQYEFQNNQNYQVTKEEVTGNDKQHSNQQNQIGQIHEGFSFNNELQKGKFLFQQQLNNINFSDEAFQTEQYSFN